MTRGRRPKRLPRVMSILPHQKTRNTVPADTGLSVTDFAADPTRWRCGSRGRAQATW